MRKDRKAFTLMEMVIVTVLIAVLSVAGFAALNNGLGVWKRLNRETEHLDLSILFVKMSRDLGNSFKHSVIGFTGSENSVSFPTVVLLASEEEMKTSIGRVIYYFDESDNTICRTQTSYSGVYRAEPGPWRYIVSEVSSARFEYYCYAPEEEQYIWIDSWDERSLPRGIDAAGDLPSAVRIHLEFENEWQKGKAVRTFNLPAGG